MINLEWGPERVRDGARGIEVNRESGHVLYGPYERRAPGSYSVRFTIVPLGPPADGDPIAAYVDVVAESGRRLIAADVVMASDLQAGGPVVLDFDLLQAGTLEYRVQATGAVPLFVAEATVVEERRGAPRKARLTTGGPSDVPRIAAERGLLLEDLLGRVVTPEAGQPGAAEAVRTMFGRLRPSRAVGYAKRRLGGPGDGAYVCVDDFRGIDTVLSFGIDHNVEFDLAAAKRGATIYQFDHTVDAPRPDDTRMVFERKMIAPEPGPDAETLPALIRRHDKGRRRPNILLKIDIECWEWAIFDALDPRELGRIRQITGEFHCFQHLTMPLWRERAARVLGKLADQFALVHVHANNGGGRSIVDGLMVSNVLEMTFVNRSAYWTMRSDETFPTALDRPCDATRFDYYLGAFSF